MVHIQSLNYTSTTYHEDYVKAVERWRYPVLGKIRKGWFRPYHAQLFIDDFRVPEICTAQFLSDIRVSDPVQFLDRKEFKVWFIRFGFKLLRFFGPWMTNRFEQKKPMYHKEGWRYNLLLGVVKDPIQICKMDGKYKEVL
jgi:hypothetical protein